MRNTISNKSGIANSFCKKATKIALIALALVLSLGLLSACGNDKTTAQTPTTNTLKIGLIQLAEHPSLDEIRNSFMGELTALNYGDKVTVDYQNAQGDPSNINSICQKFMGDDVDMIVAIATNAAQGAASITSDIPIIFSAVTDPVGAGLVTDLNKPDGNITGVSDRIPVGKIFDLAAELSPNVKNYGLVYSLGESNSVSVIKEAKAYMDSKGLTYQEAIVTNISEVAQATQSLIGKVDALFIPIDNTVASAMPNVSELAKAAKIPVYVSADSMVADGGLASVGVNYTNLGKLTAQMAVKALSGTPISEMPVEVLTEYNTVVNNETAAALGIDVSKYAK